MAKRNPADEARQLDTALNLSTEIGAVRVPTSSGPTSRKAPTDFLSQAEVDDEPYMPLPIDQPAPATPLSVDQQAQRSSLWEGYGLWDAVKDSYSSESMIFAVLAGAKDKGFELDPSYRLPALESDEWKQLTDGIPEEYHDNFEKAVSAEHARYLRGAISEEVDTDARLQEYAGTAGRFALGVVNPESLLMAAATGGASWMGKANTVRQVVTRAAIVGAAENVAVEGIIASNRETRGADDVAYAAAGGLLLGGAFGRLSAHLDPPERAAFVRLARAELDEGEAIIAARAAAASPAKMESVAAVEQQVDDVLRAVHAEAIPDAGDAPALSRPQLVQLVDEQRKQLQAARAEVEGIEAPAEVAKRLEAQMLVDDMEIHGELGAMSKHLAKARKRSAEAEARKTHKQLEADTKDRLQDAEARYVRAQSELSRFEKATGARKVLTEIEAGPADIDAKIKLIDDPDTRAILAGRLHTARAAEQGNVLTPGEAVSQGSPTSDFGGGFGADTAGAARINPLTGERRLVDDEALNPIAEVPLTTFDGARIGPFRDNAAVIHSIPDSQLRNTVGPYTGDPAGSSDGRVVPTGADEEAARVRKAARSPHALAYNSNYKEWATSRNLGALARRGMEARRAFGEEVTLHRIGAVPSTDKAVIKQAAAEDKYYEWFRTEAKRVGVKGFEELDGPPGGTAYRPRMWDKARVSEYSRGTRFGAAVIEKLIAKGFKTANADVADEIAEKVGKSIAIKLRTSHAGINDTIVGLKQADGEWLADVLRETNADEDTIAYVKRMFDMKKEPTTEGSVSHAKHRTVLDESVSVMATDRMDGRTRELPIWELLVNDAETLADTYGHRMSGAIGFARRANVFSKADHEKNLKQVLSHYEAEGKLDEGKKVTSAMDEVYKIAHGISLVNPNEHPGMTALRNTARGFRDFAFTVRMNMAWMAQLPDSSALLVGGQAKRLSRYMPELWGIWRRMEDGTLDHKFAAEIERMTGLATEGHINSTFSAFDDDITSASSKFAHGLRVMQQGTQHISLLPKVQNFNQRLFAMSYGTRLIDNALGKASDLNAQRLASAGLDEAMMKRIAEQVKAHGSISDAGNGVKIERLNTDDWADRDAADSFWSAVTREGKRAVQEEVYGEAPAWMNNWVGKVVGQFKRFGVVSHTKQMLYAAKHRDADTVQRFMYSYIMSGLAYSSQMYLYSLTKPEEERKEWREKYLSPGAIAWGAFSRAGMFSMTPALLQTALSFADVSLNDTRTSGLSGNLFTGIPAVDIAMRSYNFLRDSSVNITRGDRQFDQSDFKNARGLLPYQNAPLVKQTLDWFEQMLPEDDGDKDQNKIDLGFRD
jgi:hypothetical protein